MDSSAVPVSCVGTIANTTKRSSDSEFNAVTSSADYIETYSLNIELMTVTNPSSSTLIEESVAPESIMRSKVSDEDCKTVKCRPGQSMTHSVLILYP
jgi:hypothetical protein